MKHYTIARHKKAGPFIDYIRIDAECKKDLKEKVAEYNKAHPEEYLPLHTAFTLNK